MRKVPSRLVAIAAILAASLGCSATPPPSGGFEEWEAGDPMRAGLDGDSIEALLSELESDRLLPGLHSLLIVRHGKLVVEEYFDGWDATRLHTLQSVSKSITSALVGIAIERGDLAGVEESVAGFFPDFEIQNLDERKQAIRLEDLLTMRSGVDYDEGYAGSPHSMLNSLSRGWDRFYLDRPMTSKPGSSFQYDSGGVILASSMLQRRTGMHADVYAVEHLFRPLGVRSFRWGKNAEGHPHTGGGLYLTARDMARFGLLYLQKGRWQGRQVVPASWVETSTSEHVSFEERPWFGHGTGYGYWWWILEPDPSGPGKEPIYAALGYQGQHIMVVPEHELVVVTTGEIRDRDMHRPIDVLYTRILPAIVR